MSKWRNKGLWVAVAGLGALIIQASGVAIDLGKYNQIVEALLGVLVLAGILSNPTDGTWFRDSEVK